MKLFANPTSPFVRIVRMAIAEKGMTDDVAVTVVDAWADQPDFLAANPAGRVPTLVTDGGDNLTEAFLILRHLDAVRPEPVIVPNDPSVLGRAGLAVNVFDAAVALIIGRKSAPEFDAGIVGAKRHRTMRSGLEALDAATPAPAGGPLDIAAIAAITALDYNLFRFPDTDWRAMAPAVSALRDAHADRPSVRDTMPKG